MKTFRICKIEIAAKKLAWVDRCFIDEERHIFERDKEPLNKYHLTASSYQRLKTLLDSNQIKTYLTCTYNIYGA